MRLVPANGPWGPTDKQAPSQQPACTAAPLQGGTLVMLRPLPPLSIDLPPWIMNCADPDQVYDSDELRMRLAIRLSEENVLRGTGGPFGAGVFEESTGRVIAFGVNSVVRLQNSVLHAEIMALMLA